LIERCVRCGIAEGGCFHSRFSNVPDHRAQLV
jgi:hypothetical protein